MTIAAFHVGDIVYVKKLGVCSGIVSIIPIRPPGKPLEVFSYQLGDDLQGLCVSAEDIELVEPGPFRTNAEAHLKKKASLS